MITANVTGQDSERREIMGRKNPSDGVRMTTPAEQHLQSVYAVAGSESLWQ
jgi:hypothetical protein